MKQLIIKIEQDESGESPRDFDNLGKMICFHSRHTLGDSEHGFSVSDADDYKNWRRYLKAEHDAVMILPLYLYDHSGLTMSVEPFACPWDSGAVGFIFIDREAVAKEYSWLRVSKGRLKILKALLVQEVETYDQYLTGDVWNYSIDDGEGEVLESCCGFYGREECEKEAEAARVSLLEA